MEEWKNYIYNYDVSNFGRVRNSETGNILKISSIKNGYRCVCVSLNSRKTKKCIRVHRAVAELFLENPLNYTQINHIDGDKNNNNVSNLEWCSPSQNIVHAYKNGLMNARCKEECASSKLKGIDVEYIRNNYIPYDRLLGSRGLSRKFNISHSAILAIINKKTWC